MKKLYLILLLSLIFITSCGQKDDSNTEVSKGSSTREQFTELKEIDQESIPKSVLNLEDNPENRAFKSNKTNYQILKAGETVMSESTSETDLRYDGEVLLSDTLIHNEFDGPEPAKSTVYERIEEVDGEKNIVAYVYYNEFGNDTYEKSMILTELNNFGIKLTSDKNKDIPWTFDEKASDDKQDTYVKLLTDKVVEDQLNEQTTIVSDLEGYIKIIVQVSKETKDIINIETEEKYSTYLTFGAELEGDMEKVDIEVSSKFNDLEFDNVEKITIPQEFLDAPLSEY